MSKLVKRNRVATPCEDNDPQLLREGSLHTSHSANGENDPCKASDGVITPGGCLTEHDEGILLNTHGKPLPHHSHRSNCFDTPTASLEENPLFVSNSEGDGAVSMGICPSRISEVPTPGVLSPTVSSTGYRPDLPTPVPPKRQIFGESSGEDEEHPDTPGSSMRQRAGTTLPTSHAVAGSTFDLFSHKKRKVLDDSPSPQKRPHKKRNALDAFSLPQKRLGDVLRTETSSNRSSQIIAQLNKMRRAWRELEEPMAEIMQIHAEEVRLLTEQLESERQGVKDYTTVLFDAEARIQKLERKCNEADKVVQQLRANNVGLETRLKQIEYDARNWAPPATAG